MAKTEFEKQFSKKDYSDAGTLVVAADIWIVELIAKTGKFRSGDIRRLIQQGGVTLDSQKITDDKARVTVRTHLERFVGGATEETIIARVGDGIVSTIGAANTYKEVLERPDRSS